MKKMLALLLALLMFPSFSIVLGEENEPVTYTSGDYEYILLPDGTAEITCYIGKAADVIVPSALEGHPVTSIGSFASSSCYFSLTSVTIPNSVTSIKANPFFGCSRLTKIIVSPSHPAFSTFNNVLFHKQEKKLICYPAGLSAKEYVVPNGTVSIGNGAFISCNFLISITLPEGVTSIENVAFSSCKFLNSIFLPKGLTEIGNSAFYSCSSLSSITFPEGLTSIGDEAFSSCSSLTSVAIPDSVTSIGINPFKDCTKLTQIKVSPDQPVFSVIDNVLFHKQEKKLICYPAGRPDKNYIVPKGIVSIGESAFYSCSFITSITLPDGLTTIGNWAFYSCSSLVYITLPKGLTSIENHAFSWCSSLASITLPQGLTSIGENTFSFCNSLASITIPDSVISMRANPFVGCNKLAQIQISPDHPVFAVIDNVLFNKQEKKLICYPLGLSATQYSVPKGIVSIGDSSFRFCKSLTEILLPEGMTSIEDGAFWGCEFLASVTLPKSLRLIGNTAFGWHSDRLIFTVPRDSHASRWCKENGVEYTYPDVNDWLLN